MTAPTPHWQGPLGSIRVRILAVVLVLLAGSAAVSIVLLRGALIDRLDEEVTVALEREAEEFLLLAGGLNPRTGSPFGGDLTAIFDVYFAREVPDDGEALLAFRGSVLHRAETAPDAVPLEELEDAIAFWLTLRGQRTGEIDTPAGPVRYVAIPLQGRGAPGLLMVVNFPAAERAEIDAAVAAQAVTQFGTIILVSLLGLALAGRVLRPLASLADTAVAISTGTDLTRRIPLRGGDEASRIASAVNDMLGRLEGAFAAQRRFLDDANHELRVPLTVIRGHVELLELLPDEERAGTVALIVEEIERMNRLVDELLLLARSERPEFLTVVPVHLGELTRDVHRKAAVLDDREWILEECADTVVPADPQRLTQAMVQLAENACRHTPPGTPVRIGSSVVHGTARLWVHDAGPGIDAADAERIFGRFVKGPGESTAEGSGLGLSIVAAIAEAHGGRASVVRHSGPGARFEVALRFSGPAGQSGGPPEKATAPRTTASSSASGNGLRR